MAKPIRRLLAIAALAAGAIVPMTATAHAAPATAYTSDDGRGHYDRWKHHDKDGKHNGRWGHGCGCDYDKDDYGKGGYGNKGRCHGGGLLGGFLF
ncbi:hypothetical protein [Streptomyces sp. Wb2n-11]|uniref:hypothetical protein n=1 Tax=Streptomyces sp. Wb2n-11 TaxID=1030533 RepID=UPI000A6E6512|nr:hypothetical protein [Streptomyces sp. Wb2n-11]